MKKIKRILSVLMVLLLIAILPTAAFAETYYIDQGDITVSADSTGQYVTQVGGVQNELQTTETVITQKDSTSTSNTLTINAESGATAKVTLDGVNIDVSAKGKAAVSTTGEGNVTVELDHTNTIKSGVDHAGLEKTKTQGTLTINDTDNNGSLDATGGDSGAGIGGGNVGGITNCGENIIITGGKITATGGDYAAGIGGGGGILGEGNTITISGGEVTAKGGQSGAGIGGGHDGKGVDITISGGNVTAIGGKADYWGYGGAAGIGGGYGQGGMNIIISGGTVTAIGNGYGAGIGGDYLPNGDEDWTGDDPHKIAVSVSGDAQVSVKGGTTGAAIGHSGGENFAPNTSKLSSDGRIYYYASDAVIGQDKPVKVIHTGECVPVTDEAVDPTCTKTGLTEGSHCIVGGETIIAQQKVEKLAHNIVTDPAVEPTYTSTGLTEGSHCTTCDTMTVKQKVIPMLERPSAPLYRVTDKDGKNIGYKAEQQDGVLTITVDADRAILTGTLRSVRILANWNVEKIVLITKDAASTFTLADLLEKGSAKEAYVLTHDGNTVTFTLGADGTDVSEILQKA